MNLCSYVGNNPLSQIDPLGLRAIKLSRCVKDLLKPFFPDIDLDQVKIHDDGLPWWSKFNTVKGGPGAITSGNDIYFPGTGSSFRPPDRDRVTDANDVPVNFPDGSPAYKVRKEMVETCYCMPKPKK